MDDFHLEKMKTQIVPSPPADKQSDATRPSIHRSQSWPPVLSISNTEPSGLPIGALSSLPLRLEPTRKCSSTSRTMSESISSHSSTDTSLAPNISVEQKKEGFRASVAKRWIHTKQVLHEKAKLYREQKRARHRDKVVDSASALDEIARPNLLAKVSDKNATGKDDSHAETDKQKVQSSMKLWERKNLEKRESWNRDPERKDMDARDLAKKDGDKREAPGKDMSKKESASAKAEKSKRKGNVINPPHELSLKLSQFDVDDRERGRQHAGVSFPAAFTSRGQLLYNTYERPKRKSRTSSGRRHSWREPCSGIVPVLEETESGMENIVVAEDGGIVGSESHGACQ